VSGLIHDGFGIAEVFYFSAVLGIIGTFYIGRLLHASKTTQPPPAGSMPELEP